MFSNPRHILKGKMAGTLKTMQYLTGLIYIHILLVMQSSTSTYLKLSGFQMQI